MDSKELRGLMEAYQQVNAPQEVDEATAMAKRGYDEAPIRQKIAKSTGGGEAADRANKLENQPTYGQRGVDPKARQNLARKQRGDFRNTTSSSPGLHGYGHVSNDPKVKEKQAARGAQRGALTPAEKKQFNREEVEIAALYFYEMGLNEDGVDILIKELGVEEFAEFVYDIAEEYVLTEARKGGVKIEPITTKGQKFRSGKPTGKSLERLRKQKRARIESEAKSSASKPSGMKASLQRQSAIAASAKKQPKKPGILDRVAGAVSRGIERHNRAMSDLNKMKKATSVTAGKVRKAAGEFKRGFTEEVEIDLFDYLLEYLVAEGYADTNEAATAIMANMSEEWRRSIVEEKKETPNVTIRKQMKKKLSSDKMKDWEDVGRMAGHTGVPVPKQ